MKKEYLSMYNIPLVKLTSIQGFAALECISLSKLTEKNIFGPEIDRISK